MDGNGDPAADEPRARTAKIAAQKRAIDRCKNTRCLNRELDAAIAALSPVYLGAHPGWVGGNLYATRPRDVSAAKMRALLNARSRREIAHACGNAGLTARICSRSRARLLDIVCKMSGNQVNAQEWL